MAGERDETEAACKRAAKLSRVPGVTIAEAAARFGVAKAAVARARKTTPALSLSELAVAALSENGTRSRGKLSAATLAGVASWIDYVNHDACGVDEARALIERASAAGLLTLDGDRWTLSAWP